MCTWVGREGVKFGAQENYVPYHGFKEIFGKVGEKANEFSVWIAVLNQKTVLTFLRESLRS